MDGDEVARAGPAVAKRVEGRDAGAEQRRRLDRVEIVRHAGDRRDMGDEVRGVAAVAGHAGHLMHVLASESVVAPATGAVAAGAAEPPDAGARAHAPALDALADRVDCADHLVTGNARVSDARHEAFDGQRIAVADAAGLDANAHFLGAGDRDIPLLSLQRSARLADDHRAHLRHCRIPFNRRSLIMALGFRRTCGGDDLPTSVAARLILNRRPAPSLRLHRCRR